MSSVQHKYIDKYSGSRVQQFLPALLGLVLIIAGPFVQLSYVRLITEIMILGLFAVSYDFLFGYAGVLSFGQAALFGGGMYFTVFTFNEFGLPFIAVLLAVLVFSALLSLLIGWISLRATMGVYFAMVTLALAQVLYLITIRVGALGGSGGVGLEGRPETFLPIDLADTTAFYMVTVAIFVISFLILRRILRSPVGEILQAIKENDQRTQMSGYNVLRYRLFAFTIAGAFTGIAGFLQAISLYFAYPASLNWATTGNALIQVIIGGIGTLTGPIFGVALFTLTSRLLAPITEQWYLIFGLSVILIILVFPKGLVGTIQEYLRQ